MTPEEDLLTLYASPLSEFLDRRKALSQTLRKSGNKDLAAKVAAAAKPSPAAWAINQVARKHPDEMTELMTTGEALRAQLRASFSGRPDPKAMTAAQTAQRDAVNALVPLAVALLEAGGTSATATLKERIATTLTTISTTGKWGDGAALMLTKELDPPGIDALTALVAALEPAAPTAGGPAVEETPAERIARAKAAMQAAAADEEAAKAAVERAQTALAGLSTKRQESEARAREARRIVAEREAVVEEARRLALEATLAARVIEEELAGAARAENAAKDQLTEAERALKSASRQFTLAEETLVREQRSKTS